MYPGGRCLWKVIRPFVMAIDREAIQAEYMVIILLRGLITNIYLSLSYFGVTALEKGVRRSFRRTHKYARSTPFNCSLRDRKGDFLLANSEPPQPHHYIEASKPNRLFKTYVRLTFVLSPRHPHRFGSEVKEATQ